MTSTGLTPRDRLAYSAGFIVAAILIYATHFTSHDGDSALYAAIGDHTSAESLRQWVAPKWWALWPGSAMDELFIEHPAGLFWLPAALGRLGLPAAPSAYVVGVGASLLTLVGLSTLVERIDGPVAARATLTLLPLMPVAFIFRVRANHEYPMLLCLVVALVALEGIRESWSWLVGVTAAFAGALVIKGVFALLVVGGGGLWLVANPTGSRRGAWRAWVGFGLGLAAILLAALVYDAWYAAVTGQGFWRAYWARQVGPMTFASPLEQAGLIARHAGFYAVHVLWHSAPWGVVLVWVGGRRLWRARGPRLTTAERRAAIFVATFVLASFVALSVPSRVAERYMFSATFLLGAAGITAAVRTWPRFRGWFERVDAAVPSLPAIVWTALVAGRLAMGSP
jgi:4-amino-4-deoxy-L-arabinose transferase-like glycosyltransferase